MAIVEEGSGEAPQISDDMYTLTVVSAITGIREGPDKYNPEIVDAPIVHINTAVGDLKDDDGNPIVLRSTMNLKFSRGGTYQPSTLYLFAVAFGVCPEPGTPFDTDWLKGKKARGMVRTEKEGTWPKVIPESLIPMPKTKAVETPPFDAPSVPVGGAEPPLADALAEAAALTDWTESLHVHGYSTKELIDHAMSKYQKPLKDLTAAQRDELGKELTPA